MEGGFMNRISFDVGRRDAIQLTKPSRQEVPHVGAGDVSRAVGIDSDPMLGQLDSEALSQPDDAELGSDIRSNHCSAPTPGARRTTQDPATLPLANHWASGLAAAEKGPSKVDCDYAIPFLDRRIENGIDRDHASVIDHDIEASKGRHGPLNTRPDVAFYGYVSAHRNCHSECTGYVPRHTLAALLTK